MAVEVSRTHRTSRAKGLGSFAREKPLGAAGGVFLLLMVFTAVFAPYLAPMDPTETNPLVRLSPPSLFHLMGTDEVGRDMLSRVIYGARVSIYVGIISTLVGTALGALLGVISAYRGGLFDVILQRAMDIFMAFPTLVLALGIMAVVGQSTTNVIIAIAIPFIPRTNRVVRAQALAVKEFPFVEAARAIGCPPTRIIFRHILPNCLAPYLVVATAFLGTAVLVEASLSFLGLGIPPPTPSWGRDLSSAMLFFQSAPGLAVFPGIAISIAVFGANLLGDALRDVWDPKLKLT